MKLKMLATALVAFCAFSAQAANLTISPKGQEFLFDKDTLTVKAGEKVKLTLKNTSALQHNWVLTKPGANDKVAQEGIAAGAGKNWIPDSPEIIAHTKLVDPSKSETIEFTAPAKGSYPYVCTFPGHSATMKGTLVVK